jgi:hypothetical protein
MKTFQDFLTEAAPPMFVHIKADKIGKSTEDNIGTFLRVSVSGDKATFETPDGRKIILTGAKDIISASGLKDGQFASAQMIDKVDTDTAVKYNKSGKYIDLLDVKSGMGNSFISIDGNKQWKEMTEGGWYAYKGGRPGLARYKIAMVMGPHAGMPSPGEDIEYELPNGGKERGTVMKLNGASKLMDVKNEKGKKVQVSMYVK